MIRVVIENVLLFLLPSLAYLTYAWLTRPRPAEGRGDSNTRFGDVVNDAPLLWLFSLGALLVVMTLIAFGHTAGGRPGEIYVPPSMKDGRIDPGNSQ